MAGVDRDGLVPVADIQLDELRDLETLLTEYVGRKVRYLEREQRLAESLHTYFGERRTPIPADLSGLALKKFGDYVRLR